MSIDLTPIIQAIIGLLAALITWKVIPWIQSKTTAQQKRNLSSIVRTLVFAAEQLYGANKGDEKLDYVIARLEEYGFKADRAEIEAAVYQAFNSIPPLESSADNHDISRWGMAKLMGYCEVKGINTDNCVTHEDYVQAIKNSIEKESDEENEEPSSGRVSNAPPDSAVENREE